MGKNDVLNLIQQANQAKAKHNSDHPEDKIGGSSKSRLEILAYNHARQKTLRQIREAHQTEFDEMLAKNQASCIAEKTELLKTEASNGDKVATEILTEANVA